MDNDVAPDETEEAGPRVRSVVRACSILTAFTSEANALTAAELMARTGLSRPTLYRLLSTLQECDFISAEGEPMRFRLGTAVAGLAAAWHSGFDITVVARQPLRELWTRTRETIVLFMPSGFERVCLFELPSPQPLSFRRGIGYRSSLIRGATGRAILAFMQISDERVAEEASEVGPGFASIIKELERIRSQGFAYSSNELIPGAAALAAPIFRAGGSIAASIGILAPESRLNGEYLDTARDMLCETAVTISELLGFGAAEYQARISGGANVGA